MDGIDKTPQNPALSGLGTIQRGDASKLAKTAEEYVAIENRLAAQREKPSANPQFTSIFDQLRDQLGR